MLPQISAKVSKLLASACRLLSLLILPSTSAIFSLFNLEPNILFVKPPSTPKPAEATAPQGPGIALAKPLRLVIALPTSLDIPPPIAPPAIFPSPPAKPLRAPDLKPSTIVAPKLPNSPLVLVGVILGK